MEIATPAAAPVGGTGRVIDLQAARARLRPAPIPPAVFAEVDAAARLAGALHAQGHELRFVAPHEGRGVRAELRTLDGRVVRPVSLLEAVGLADDPRVPAA